MRGLAYEHTRLLRLRGVGFFPLVIGSEAQSHSRRLFFQADIDLSGLDFALTDAALGPGWRQDIVSCDCVPRFGFRPCHEDIACPQYCGGAGRRCCRATEKSIYRRFISTQIHCVRNKKDKRSKSPAARDLQQNCFNSRGVEIRGIESPTGVFILIMEAHDGGDDVWIGLGKDVWR